MLELAMNCCFKALFIGLVALVSFVALAESKSSSGDYLYRGDDEAHPVIDLYKSPEAVEPEKPEFLYGQGNPARVVEWYAPWCPVG